jgi:succinate dehydrogenase/fumarate reductase cytochrome b subunit
MSILRTILNDYTNYDSNNSNDNKNIIIIITIVTITHMKQSACLILIKYHQIDWFILVFLHIIILALLFHFLLLLL